jgi:hypothetical protein
MLTNCFFTLYLFANSFVLPVDSFIPTDEIKKFYKDADLIFTGFLTNKYQNASTRNLEENSFMVEFEVTEIQKGPRRQKVLLNINNGDSLSSNYEYLVFIKNEKKNSNKKRSIIAIYQVCPKCPNSEVRQVYSIVMDKPFGRIKKPLPLYTKTSGCGC